MALKIKVVHVTVMAARAGTVDKVSKATVVQGLAVQWEHVAWEGLLEEGLQRDGRQRLGLGQRESHLLTTGPTAAQKDSQMDCHAGGQAQC